jgi:hypothetical protein
MRICIYCLERKPDDAFDREHVIPHQAFGRFENEPGTFRFQRITSLGARIALSSP